MSPTYTLTEDFALGMAMKKTGWQCRYVQDYCALGEAPEQVRNCYQQRSRWCKVSSECDAVAALCMPAHPHPSYLPAGSCCSSVLNASQLHHKSTRTCTASHPCSTLWLFLALSGQVVRYTDCSEHAGPLPDHPE